MLAARWPIFPRKRRARAGGSALPGHACVAPVNIPAETLSAPLKVCAAATCLRRDGRYFRGNVQGACWRVCAAGTCLRRVGQYFRGNVERVLEGLRCRDTLAPRWSIFPRKRPGRLRRSALPRKCLIQRRLECGAGDGVAPGSGAILHRLLNVRSGLMAGRPPGSQARPSRRPASMRKSCRRNGRNGPRSGRSLVARPDLDRLARMA